jgi:SOS-response transcriptional repressor LexA
MSCQAMANEVIEMLRDKAVNRNCPNYSSDCSDYIERVELALRQDWDNALDPCEFSSALCSDTSVDADYCRAIAQMYEGACYHSAGHLEKAEHCYRQSANAFSIMKHDDCRWCEAVARYALGSLAQSDGDWYLAHRLYHQGLHLFQHLARKGVHVYSAEPLVKEKLKLLDLLRRQRHKAQERVDSVPVIGTTAAGEPIIAIEVSPDDVLADRISLRDRDCKIKKILEADRGATLELKPGSIYFALRVEGNSMTWVGIDNGDYVIFRQQPDADSGNIVVVRIDDLYGSISTVKRFYRQGKTIRLKAENPQYQPQIQIFGAGDPTIEILGKALAVASLI